MLFVTNHRPLGGPRAEVGRRLSFDQAAPEPGAGVVFGRRRGAGVYEDLTAAPFFERLRRAPARQVLLYVHGHDARVEEDGFRPAAVLSRLLAPVGALVVPVLWPGGGDRAVAAFSGVAFASALDRFREWRVAAKGGPPRVSVLACGAGARVLRDTLWWQDKVFGPERAMFFGAFMAAPDVADDTLEPAQRGAVLARRARHVVVYANRADAVLGAKAARLGLAGPACLDLAAANVAVVDATAAAPEADPVRGHAYHLLKPDGEPGAVVRHLLATLSAGRVVGCRPWRRKIVLKPGFEGLTAGGVWLE